VEIPAPCKLLTTQETSLDCTYITLYSTLTTVSLPWNPKFLSIPQFECKIDLFSKRNATADNFCTYSATGNYQNKTKNRQFPATSIFVHLKNADSILKLNSTNIPSRSRIYPKSERDEISNFHSLQKPLKMSLQHLLILGLCNEPC